MVVDDGHTLALGQERRHLHLLGAVGIHHHKKRPRFNFGGQIRRIHKGVLVFLLALHEVS